MDAQKDMRYLGTLREQTAKYMNPAFFKSSLGVDLTQKEIDSLAAGNTSRVLNIQDNDKWLRAKIRLDVSAEGHIRLKIAEIREKLEIPESIGSAVISDKGRSILERGIPIPGPKGFAIVADQERNTVKAVPYKELGIPSKIAGVRLNDKEKFLLMSGKTVPLKGTVTDPGGNPVSLDLQVRWDSEKKSLHVKNDEKSLGLTPKQNKILDYRPTFVERISRGAQRTLAAKYAEQLGHTGKAAREKGNEIYDSLVPRGGAVSFLEFRNLLSKRMLESNIRAHALKISVQEPDGGTKQKKTVLNSLGRENYEKSKKTGKTFSISRAGDKAISAGKEFSNTLSAGMG